MEHAETTWKVASEVVAVEHSFEDFFELEQERLLRLLWVVTGSLQEAEDIVQDAFLRVWERWPTVSSMDSPSGYLHHAAMNIFRTGTGGRGSDSARRLGPIRRSMRSGRSRTGSRSRTPWRASPASSGRHSC